MTDYPTKAGAEPKAFALSNLSSVTVAPCTPWTFKEVPPPSVRTNKAARDGWINSPTVKWQVYSLIEGLNENRRIKHASATCPEAESNPLHRIHGFVADYDAPVPDEFWRKRVGEFSHPPQYVEKTLSGNFRCLWLFEEPLLLPGSKFTKFFLEEVLAELRVENLLPGFDRPAWIEANRYYTNSGEWFEIAEGRPIPSDRLRGWMVEMGSRYSWNKEPGGVEVPFDVLRTELQGKYPRFAEWPGEFALGEQGPTFWVEDSTSPKSAIVRETGIQTFAAHAPKSFYTWADLIGYEKVKEFKTEDLGRAVEGIYHDGKYYWRALPSGFWRSFSKEDTVQHLRVNRGVSPKRDKKGINDLERAILHVQNHQNVTGAGPFVLHPPGVMEVNGDRVLNISTRKVLTPSEEDTPWGPHGKMPFLSQFIGFSAEEVWSPGFLPSPVATDHLLSWAHRYYKGGYEQAPVSGHMLFLAGPVGIGKTFFNALLGRLMGGHVDAESFLLNNDSFNSDLFGFAHWTIDDGVMTSALNSMRMFAEKAKKIVANRAFRSNEKFRVATMVKWQGRLVVSTNVDEESIRAIPDLGGSILDKVMLFRTVDVAPVVFPEQSECERILKVEAPYFARKLLNFKIPDYCRGKARFGVEPYHDASLLLAAEHSSSTGAFLDILQSWKRFNLTGQEEYWEGTAFDLHQKLAAFDVTGSLTRRYDTGWVNRQLSALKNKGHRIDCINGQTRVWRIYRDQESR